MSKLSGQIIKYLTAGALTVLVEYGSFLFFHVVAMPLIAANSTSYLLGLLTSFTVNRMWVFKKHDATTVHSLSKQLMLYGCLIILNITLINIIIVLTTNIGLVPEIGKLIAMVSIAIWNFVVYKKIIFKNSGEGL